MYSTIATSSETLAQIAASYTGTKSNSLCTFQLKPLRTLIWRGEDPEISPKGFEEPFPGLYLGES